MNKQVNFKGTRWYKCDLHVHTPESQCFEDKTITAIKWVESAISAGLDCVAVTDHNSGRFIDELKKAAEGTGLIIFPGVEITCDASKIHLLVLFDTSKGSADIRDFLVRADIRADDFGKQNASTIKSIFDIAELAIKDGAVVIPAHIDEFNGIGTVSVENLKKLFSDYHINAAQIVHERLLDPNLQIVGNIPLQTYINDYYNNPTPPIDNSTIKEWHSSIKYAILSKIALLTFSDNPHENKSSKHGVWGIGKSYSWIKMDENPTIESLRQAFLLPEFRVKNEFQSKKNPYTEPNLWIRSIAISNTLLTGKGDPFKVEFNPQLNTIIGGRGSGKSSILRFLRGVFNRTLDLKELGEILKDQEDFYRIEGGRPKKGVLTENSEIEIEFVRNNCLNKIKAEKICDSKAQKIIIQRYNENTSQWELINDEGYIEFFEFDHYSQKQIYEIAQQPNALRERIDNAIDGVLELKKERDQIKRQYFEKAAAIRTNDQLISGKGRIETKIRDLEDSIKKLQQSGIADLIISKEKFANQAEVIDIFQCSIKEKSNSLKEVAASIEIGDIDYSIFDAQHQDSLKPISSLVVSSLSALKVELESITTRIEELQKTFTDSMANSKWKIDFNKNIEDFNLRKQELENEGIRDIEHFETYTQEKTDLEKSIEVINAKTIIRDEDLKEKILLQSSFVETCKTISSKRKDFVTSILKDGKVKINIKPFRNQSDFESQLRKILQRENESFQSDVDQLISLCFEGNVEEKILEVRNVFRKILNGEDVSSIVTGHFVNLVKNLNDTQLDEIFLFMPEDEIEVQYKPSSASNFKSLSTASAGQKTTAILTFILSYGKVPLILDQPEDDLDNRLVYDLIVDRLRQAKESRQLIIVTHNANVPVNGDAEYIISLGTESKTLRILNQGTLDESIVKKEICSVMEGGQLAFDMRSKRYKQIKNLNNE